MKRSLFALLFAGFLLNEARAEDINNVQILRMERYSNMTVGCNPTLTKEMFIRFKDSNGNPYSFNSTNTEGSWFILRESDGYKDILAMLLTSATSGTPLRVRFDRSQGNCSGEALIQGVSLIY